jgi:hypothetical protein
MSFSIYDRDEAPGMIAPLLAAPFIAPKKEMSNISVFRKFCTNLLLASAMLDKAKNALAFALASALNWEGL